MIHIGIYRLLTYITVSFLLPLRSVAEKMVGALKGSTVEDRKICAMVKVVAFFWGWETSHL